jgi:uncharacterized protein YndB with AHSA1/START domain
MMTQNSTKATTLTLPSEREIMITRSFNAPRELVFKAHLDPVLIPLWWGPRSTTTEVEELDAQVGGEWRFIHRTDDGREMSFYGEFRDITPYERIVQTSEFSGAPGHAIIETILFDEQNGKTHVTVIDQFDTMEERDMVLQSGMEGGLAESYERLEELAQRMGPDGPKQMVITRIFDAPRALVWKAWTDPETLMRWWGPKYFTSPVAKIDLREGGEYLFAMRSPEGQDLYSTGTYKKIDPMNEIIYTDSFSDAEGNIIPPSVFGMGDDYPVASDITVRFEDYDGKTKLTVIGNRPQGIMGEYATAGWNESLDKLADSLSKS